MGLLSFFKGVGEKIFHGDQPAQLRLRLPNPCVRRHYSTMLKSWDWPTTP